MKAARTRPWRLVAPETICMPFGATPSRQRLKTRSNPGRDETANGREQVDKDSDERKRGHRHRLHQEFETGSKTRTPGAAASFALRVQRLPFPETVPVPGDREMFSNCAIGQSGRNRWLPGKTKTAPMRCRAHS